MRRLGSLIACGSSLGMHLAILATLGAIHYSTQQSPPDLLIMASFSDGRDDLGIVCPIAGVTFRTDSLVTQFLTDSAFGPRKTAAVPQRAETDNRPVVKEREPSDGISIVCPPDFEANGPLEWVGYADALSQMMQELIRLMRQQPVLVVWLFDESSSMQDDQLHLSRQMLTIYQELESVTSSELEWVISGTGRRTRSGIKTAITSFGEKFTALTPQPTSYISDIQAAMDKIGVDESGTENVCLAINSALDKFGQLARATRSRLVLVLVTDESGDDGEEVEATLEKCQWFNAPVYVLGREADFGSSNTRRRWQDPQTGLDHWLPIHRGPEAPFPEALQWDGLQARRDATLSGFGPHAQARLVSQTGGLFFGVRGEAEQRVGREPVERRGYQPLDMKEYLPSTRSREDYQQQRDASVFRSAVWETIVRLDPHRHPELKIQQENYPTDREGFAKVAGDSFKRALSAMHTLEAAITTLEKVRPLREREASMRWRANSDLILAQCLAYRVRLYQFCLALDQHQRNFPVPAPAAPHHNVWNIEHVPQMLPADLRVTRLKDIDLQRLADQEQQAREMFQFVQTTHPGTPWAARAAAELAKGFGFRVVSRFRDPLYDDLDDTKFPRQ